MKEKKTILQIEGCYENDIYHKQRLGIALRAARRVQHMSQLDLSQKATVDCTHISKVENGLSNISIGRLCRLCEALQIRLSPVFSLLEENSVEYTQLFDVYSQEEDQVLLEILKVLL